MNCPRNGVRASQRNARETAIGCGYGKCRNIGDLQTVQLKLSKHKTKQLYPTSFPSTLPDIRKGIRIKASRATRFAGIAN